MRATLPSVLVVDDNADFLRVACAALENGTPAFVVQAVRSGAEAVAALRRSRFEGGQPPSFVILDFRLGDLDAPAVLRMLRTPDGGHPSPVLVLSQARWEEDERAAMRAGAKRFCVKPSSVQALREVFLDFYHQCVSTTEEEVVGERLQFDARRRFARERRR